MGKIFGLLLCVGFMAFSSPASAVLKCGTAGIKIDARNFPYSAVSAVQKQDVGITDDWSLRAEVMTGVAGAYRLQFGSLGPGSMFKMIYKDGTRECAAVGSTTASLGTVPVPGTASNGPNAVLEVENTSLYIQQFQRPQTGVAGWYRVCFDYYSNGQLTTTECHIEPF